MGLLDKKKPDIKIPSGPGDEEPAPIKQEDAPVEKTAVDWERKHNSLGCWVYWLIEKYPNLITLYHIDILREFTSGAFEETQLKPKNYTIADMLFQFQQRARLKIPDLAPPAKQ